MTPGEDSDPQHSYTGCSVIELPGDIYNPEGFVEPVLTLNRTKTTKTSYSTFDPEPYT